MKQQETAYKSTLQATVKEFELFTKEKMPSILEQFQKWEEERASTLGIYFSFTFTHTLVSVLKAYKAIQSGVPGVYEK